jgi:DNA repair protein RecN (Recombination protein N)
LDSIWIELKDLSSEIEREAEGFSSDPLELEDKQKRLDALQRLLQKHQKNSIEELIILRDSLDEQIVSFEHIDEAVAAAKKTLDLAQNLCEEKAQELSASRQVVLSAIQSALTESLQHLGIPNAVLDWEIETRTCVAMGMDKISLLFSANKGLAPKPFKQIASGGELSRLMLSVKHLLAQKRAMPTLILDEIDTGVSGEVAFQMANMLRQMGQAHQIIAITHLPQIAAAGKQHWFVFKNHSGEKTVSSIRGLTDEDRVDEIAKMIGGQNGYQALKENVRELLAANEK